MPDHVHLLVRVRLAVSPGSRDMAFSVSESQAPMVRRYIANQAAHHRKRTFREEFLELLEKHGVEYDERYVLG